MPFDLGVATPPAHGGVSPVNSRFEGGHVLQMVYDKAWQRVFTVDRYYDAQGALLPSKLHRFDTVFDAAVGIPHAEVSSVSAAHQFVDVAVAGGVLLVLRAYADAAAAHTRFFLDKLDPETLAVLETLEVYECSLTAMPMEPAVWLVGKTGLLKRLDVYSLRFAAEVACTAPTNCGRAVIDPVMNLLLVPRMANTTGLHDAMTGEHLGDVAFPWDGPGQCAHVIVPPHGEQNGYNPPIVCMSALDVGFKSAKLTLFRRDVDARSYVSTLVEIPFTVGPLAPYSQTEGYVGLCVAYSTIDGRAPGDDAAVAASPADAAKRLLFIARNGYLPSAAKEPLGYFIGRRVDLENYAAVSVFSSGLPYCSPYKTRIVMTNNTARMWLASCSIGSAEERQLLTGTVAM